MSTSREWQLDHSSARRYEEVAVPHILGPAARALVAWAEPNAAEHVLDIGCGTGVASRSAAEAVGADGAVVGIDNNAGMIAVAREVAPAITFENADATSVPFPDRSFDLVLCAHTLQFLPDKQAAIAEMARLMKPGGRVAISIWAPIEKNPYNDMTRRTVAEILGDDVAAGSGTAFIFTSLDELKVLLANESLVGIKTATVRLDLPLGRLEEFVPRHIAATPMAAVFASASAEHQAEIIQNIAEGLQCYTGPDGMTTVPFSMNLALALRPD